MSLGLCTECKRFARAGEPCPFCGAAIAKRSRKLRPHVSRAALVMVGALVTQCDCKPEPIVQPYGAPPTPPQPELDAGALANPTTVLGTGAPDAAAMPKDKQ